jgi:hypothetical protein
MTPAPQATPTQIRYHHERQARLMRMGIIEASAPIAIAAPELPQEAPEPIPAPEVPPEPVVAAVAGPLPDAPQVPDFSTIVRDVCAKHGVTKQQLKGTNRQLEVCLARHEAFFRLHTERGMSLPQIGRMLGGFDHTSVLYGVRRHQARMGGLVLDKRHSISWTPERRERALSMRRAGATMAEIAEVFGCGATAVSAAFHRWRSQDVDARASKPNLRLWVWQKTRAA